MEKGVELGRLGTEAVRGDGRLDLESMSTAALVRVMADDVADVHNALTDAVASIAEAVDRIVERMREGGRLIYLGAGTSGRLAAMDAAECVPTFNADPAAVQAVVAGGGQSLASAVEDAEDRAEDAQASLASLKLRAADAVVGVSASGTTPFVLGGIEYAREVGALTVGIANNADVPLVRRPDIGITLVVGPEILAGSTRLKSGTAQKVALNAISTFTMVRLGKTYRNLMVDVRPSNAKLRDRSARIVATVTGADGAAVAEALRDAAGDTKTAIVMLMKSADAAAARTLLDESRGSLRLVIDT